MFTFTTADVHAIEHNLHVDRVNRRGWLMSSLTDDRDAGQSSTIVGRLIGCLFHGMPNGADVAIPVGDASPPVMSHIHGVA
jgi:hypothetical protein